MGALSHGELIPLVCLCMKDQSENPDMKHISRHLQLMCSVFWGLHELSGRSLEGQCHTQTHQALSALALRTACYR